MPAVSVRQFALLLMLLLTAVLARQQPETRQDRRSTHVRGVSSSRLARQLEIGHGDKSEDGKGKGGSSSSRGKGGKSEKVPKGGGSGKGHYNDDDEEATEPHYDSEDLPSTDNEDDSTSGDEEDSKGKSPKGGPGTDKGDDEGKGKDKDEGKGKGKGKGNEHFQHEDVETFRRNVPDFAISYVIARARRAQIPQEADYNELAVVSEEFLDRMFGSVFEDLAVGHFGTAAYALINENAPFLVSFRITLDFTMPGEVPTVPFLIDRVQEAFEREASRTTYLFDLNTMSETNPFSATTSFNLVTGSGNNNNEVNAEPGNSNKPPKVSNTMTKNHVILIILGCVSFVLLVLTVILWMQGRKQPNQKFQKSDQRKTDSAATLPFYSGKLGIDGRGYETERSASSDEYGADDETVQYLNALRARYKDQVVENDEPEAERTIGYRDVVEDQNEIKEAKDGILFLKLDDQQTAESAYGGGLPVQPIQPPPTNQPISVRDLLNMEMNTTEIEDDLGSIMN